MPSPPVTSFMITNLGSVDVVVGTKTITASGGTATYTSAEIPGVCNDLAFRVGVLLSTMSMTINGNVLGGQAMLSSATLSSFLDDIASGMITIP